MARTAALYVLPAALVVGSWLTLEEDAAAGAAAWMAALALLPGLVRPVWGRVVAAVAAALVAAPTAFGVSIADARPLDDRDFFGPLGARFADGVLQYYEISLPFVRHEHALMHGVVLAAVFGFCLAVSLAIAARRPLVAALALLVGAAWPATLVADGGAGRGALILATVLLLLAAGGHRPPVTYRRAALAGGLLVAAALVGASMPAVAKGEFLSWKQWDLYDRPDEPVSVRFVWNADYAGIRFPEKRTTVLTVDGVSRPLYWRATTLDEFTGGRWREQLGTIEVTSGTADMLSDQLVPARAHDPTQWLRASVTIRALRERRLVAPSMPVRYVVPHDVGEVEYLTGGVARARGPLRRDASYVVFAHAPEPKPDQLARVRPSSLRRGTVESRYLEVAPGAATLPWRTPGSVARVENLLHSGAQLEPYRALWDVAREVAGGRASPYGATVALERWFRSQGGFTYDEQPGAAWQVPPLVDFVTRGKRGYCQHFAGAMTLMLRYLGIPARVAAGFRSGSFDREERRWTVSDHDAHTWVEVWFQGWGWLPFDPTPGQASLSGSYSFASKSLDAGAVARVLDGSGARRESPAIQGERIRGTTARTVPPRDGAAFGRGEGASLLALLAALAGMLVVTVGGFKAARRRWRELARDPRRVAAACRAEVADFLVDQGIAVERSATIGELAEAIERTLSVDARRFAAATGAARFARPETAASAARSARVELRALRRRLRARLTLSERARGVVSLRSLGLSG